MSDDTTQTEPTLEPGTEQNQEQNPLLPDLQKWKEKARKAEAIIEERRVADDQAATLENAKSKDDFVSLEKELQAKFDAKNRKLDLQTEGAGQGIDTAFVRAADDGKSDIAEILKNAKENQSKFLERSLQGKSTEPVNGAATPSGDGKKVWKESEVAALDQAGYRSKRDEIKTAITEGRYKAGE